MEPNMYVPWYKIDPKWRYCARNSTNDTKLFTHKPVAVCTGTRLSIYEGGYWEMQEGEVCDIVGLINTWDSDYSLSESWKESLNERELYEENI